MAKVLCMLKMRSGCCCTMHSLCRASQMVVACGSLGVRMMPSILWILGVLLGVRMCTFFGGDDVHDVVSFH
jgi:hypothetical protein